MKPPILCIVGPTAVGKTDFFIKLVQAGYAFEAIVADSRQVYRFMDIGTGKDLPTDPKIRKKFWLIDAVTPDQSFSSAHFHRLANQAIDQIYTLGHQPVIVGGTGRYIKDLQTNPDTLLVPTNSALRQQLAQQSVPQLQTKLQQLNPQRLAAMNHSDSNNPRRLIRAIEVSLHPISTRPQQTRRFLMIGLTAPLQLIKARIEARVDARLRQGMVEEVKQLLQRYPNYDQLQSFATPGYQEIAEYLSHRINLDEARARWTKREVNYAKRQLTWFRHQSDTVWFDITSPSWYAEAVKQLRKWRYVPSYSQN